MVKYQGDDERLDAGDWVEVEVAYAKPEEQAIVKLSVPKDTTVEQAIQLSGLLSRFPEINATTLKAGIFSVICKPEQRLRDGDRVEIYRSLINDPKVARRIRASRQ
jgi:putative ubiquitin-RnfH superfamily antitoxin RatB of RatAB toxin-antitoxin module